MTNSDNDPLDELVSAFRRMSVPDPPDPALMFPRPTAPRAMGETAGTNPSRVLWRFLMRPTVRYGSAAAMLVVALGWLMLAPSRSFALGEVIRAAEQHKLVRYRFHWTATDKPGAPDRIKGTVYADLLHPRTRFEADPEPYGEGVSTLRPAATKSLPPGRDGAGKSLLQVTIYDRRTGATFNESSVSRRVVEADGRVRVDVRPLHSTLLEPSGNDDHASAVIRPLWGDILPSRGISANTPFLDVLGAMEKRKDTSSANTQLGGRAVVKFSAKEAHSTYTVWIDPATKLPVQIEVTFPDSSRNGEIIRLVCTDFVWDPPVADLDALFRTTLPSRERRNKDAKNK
jgi:hypothetical protein